MVLALLVCAALAPAPAASGDAAPSPAPAVPEASPPQVVKDDSSVAVGVGMQKVIGVHDLKAIAVAAPTVVDVRYLGATQLLLVGLSPGHSDLTLFMNDGRHTTFKIEVGAKEDGDACLLCQAFRDSPNLKVERVGGQLVVDGLLGSVEDWERLQLFPEVRCLAQLDPRYVKGQVRRINEELKRAGLRDVQAVMHGPHLVTLEGSVEDEALREKAQFIADAIYQPLARALTGIAAASVR